MVSRRVSGGRERVQDKSIGEKDIKRGIIHLVKLYCNWGQRARGGKKVVNADVHRAEKGVRVGANETRGENSTSARTKHRRQPARALGEMASSFRGEESKVHGGGGEKHNMQTWGVGREAVQGCKINSSWARGGGASSNGKLSRNVRKGFKRKETRPAMG